MNLAQAMSMIPRKAAIAISVTSRQSHKGQSLMRCSATIRPGLVMSIATVAKVPIRFHAAESARCCSGSGGPNCSTLSCAIGTGGYVK